MMTSPPLVRCAAHPDVETALRCGKCDKPICPRCLVETPVGMRCRECARLNRPPTYRVSGLYYARAAGTAFGLAIGIGVAWAFIERALPFYLFTLFLAAGIGWVIGEVVSLSVNRKRGTGLAVIGGAAVVLSYAVSYLVDYAITGFFIINMGRIGFTLAALAVGVYFAVNRLR